MYRVLNIAIFTGLLKPPNGRQNRFLALTKQLRRFNNDVIVLMDGAYRDERDRQYAETYCYRELTLFGKRLAVLRDLNPNFVRTLARLVNRESVSIIQISHPSGCLAVKFVCFLSGRKVRIVYDAHNVEAELVQETLEGGAELPALGRVALAAIVGLLERLLCRHFADRILTVSERDAAAFQRRYGVETKRIAIIPSGCTISPPPSAQEKQRAKESFQISPDRIVAAFHGFFPYPPNREAFEAITNYIAPDIRRSHPEVFFLLGGTGARCFERENVKSVGFIPNLRDFLSAADLAVVPITRGSGTRLKVLDYMAVALPIVATKKGVEGIGLLDGEHAFLSEDSLPDFLTALRRALNSRHRWSEIGLKAQKLAQLSYDWNAIGAKLNEVFVAIQGGETCA